MKREDNQERQHSEEREDWKLEARHPCRRKVERGRELIPKGGETWGELWMRNEKRWA